MDKNKSKYKKLLFAGGLTIAMLSAFTVTANAEPDYTDSTYYEDPGYEDPNYEDPGYEDPNYEDSGYEDPNYEDPGYEDSNYEDPGYEDPSYEDPGYEDPSYEDPGYEDPNYEDPGYEDPNYEDPGYEEPSYTENSYYDDSTDEPSTDTPSEPSDTSVDTTELTSDDWENLENQLASDVSTNANKNNKNSTGEFDSIKDSESKENDAWIFLVIGLPLLLLGLAGVAFIVFYNIKVKKSEIKSPERAPIRTKHADEADEASQLPSKEAFEAVKAARKNKNPEKSMSRAQSDLENTLDKPLKIDDIFKDSN